MISPNKPRVKLHSHLLSQCLKLNVHMSYLEVIKQILSFPYGSLVRNLPTNVGDTDSSPGPGRSDVLRTN